ncbi:MAG: NFACT family protein [Eubacteriales bacterium]|nr:NFACT family protein [Eubacteriales bacterium]
MDGFTLSFMARELRDALVGGRVERASQPERDALLLTVRNQGRNEKLLLSASTEQARAQLTEQSYENPAQPPMFCMLMRKYLQGARIAAIEQWRGDRVLTITLDCMGEMGDAIQKTLVLEIMGRYSNLTLVDEKGVIVDCLRHVNSEMSRVRMLLPGVTFAFPPAQDKLQPTEITGEALAARLIAFPGMLEKALIENISGLAKISAREVCAQIGADGQTFCDLLDTAAAARSVAAFYQGLHARFAPVTIGETTGRVLDFFPFLYLTFAPDAQKPAASLSAAMDAFYLGRDIRLRMQQRGAGLQKQIKTNLSRLEKKQEIMLETLGESEKAEQNRLFGELLTANMHIIPRGAADVTVANYYDPDMHTVTIALSTQLTPAQNAQLYYKKYRKAINAEKYAVEQLAVIQSEMELLDNALDDLDKCSTTTDLSEIRALLVQSGFVRPDAETRKRKKPPEGKPYHFTAPDGTEILVGKNALQNDRLTLHARAEETWLHAQGMPGSHVIIRTEAVPAPETLLLAAKLAAYYSKGRNHPSLPVDYTRRKHIKKGASAAAGLVTYTNFQTIFVGLTPEEMVTISRAAAEN